MDKFIVFKYFEFSMVDDVSTIYQVYELQILVSRLRDLQEVILKSLQVKAIISKLCSTWNDYRKKLLHLGKDFIVEKLLRHLRIEEEN